MTGVEGIFRGSCEQILRLARSQGAALAEVLQTILTDPLLDWIPGEEQDSIQKVLHTLRFWKYYQSASEARAQVPQNLNSAAAALQCSCLSPPDARVHATDAVSRNPFGHDMTRKIGPATCKLATSAPRTMRAGTITKDPAERSLNCYTIIQCVSLNGRRCRHLYAYCVQMFVLGCDREHVAGTMRQCKLRKAGR